ncbi:MAG: hypothetical protein KC486_36560, partial [Myxococcales bacterium]|nr:hypothetical protein [Myxococcales bacterium]
MFDTHAPPTPALSLAAAALALVAACGGAEGETAGESDAATATGTDTDADGYTWWRDVEPVVRARCVTCHSPGNIGPFSLATHEEFVNLAPILGPAIESGSMPPWLPDAGCNDYKNSLALDLDEEALLLDYLAGDMPEGDPADAPPEEEPPPEFVPDVVLEMPESFTPTQSPDDYRCFTIPWPEEFTDDAFVTATEVYPGERAIVH